MNNNDTIRKGITIGVPGSGQRIADLAAFYARSNAVEVSAFNPCKAVSYAAESVLRYNHTYVDTCHQIPYRGYERERDVLPHDNFGLAQGGYNSPCYRN